METSSIELPGSHIGSIAWQGDQIRIRFTRAIIVKTMTGSAERTRWWQAGDLILGEASLAEDLPLGPQLCVGGEIGENLFTYRDMIPIPLETRGRCRCALRFEGCAREFVAEGMSLSLQLQDVPKYIEHIRPSAEN